MSVMTPTAPISTVAYPTAHAPNFWDPDPAIPNHRSVLGQLDQGLPQSRPLVVLGMNPSYANNTISDATVNRVAEASIQLGYSGWAIVNLYPERATQPKNLGAFDQRLCDDNCIQIERFIKSYGIDESFGAWGNPPNATIRLAKPQVLRVVRGLGVRIFHFGNLTTKGEPRHLTPRRGRLDLSGPRVYL